MFAPVHIVTHLLAFVGGLIAGALIIDWLREKLLIRELTEIFEGEEPKGSLDFDDIKDERPCVKMPTQKND